jgi:hypothetical protein
MTSCLKLYRKLAMYSNVYECKTEEDQPTLEEIAGLYLFTPDELSVYLDWKAASKNESLSKKQRNRKRSNAVEKLRNVIDKRMPMDEKLVLEANIQAETDRKSQEKIQLIEKALPLCTPKQREDYDALLAGATDPINPPAKQQRCADGAKQKLRNIVAKQAEKEKRAAMTTEELAIYENDPKRVAAKAHPARNHRAENTKHTKKEAALRLAGDKDAIARQHTKKEAALRLAGDKDAIARQAARNEAQRKRMAAASQDEKEKRAAMTTEELAMYDNDPDRIAANADKARIRKEGDAKNRKKEAVLRNAGDPDAIARRAAKNETERKRSATTRQRKKEDDAKNTKIFSKSARNSTDFGEGDARQEALTRIVDKIMGSHAGSTLDPSGKPTSEKWVKDHGDVSVGDKLAEGGFAAYLGITRTTVHPGKEEECAETTLFLTQVQRDPLWRMLQKDGDLKRMSPKQAKSVVNVYLLAKYENPYDVTSLEGACQFYLENELGLPHGICLHRRVGAGNRLKDSMTDDEYKLFRSGKLLGWSLNLTMIRTTDQVFSDIDPFDPERSPPLVSASVPTHDGTGTVYRIRVRGNKQRFPDTPSVVADRAAINDKKEKDKARRQKRKRDAAKSVDATESPEETEEKTAKKSKI